MKRGIIAAPGVITLTLTGTNFSPSLSAEDIRFYLLYWDRVVIPTNNLVHFAVADEDDLIRAGAIWRPRVVHHGAFHGPGLGKAIIQGQCEIASLMTQDKETDWAIHQVGEQIVLPESQYRREKAIRLELSNALPVPGPEVPINEILEFKERRHDELLSLHEAIDELYTSVLQAPDPSLEQAKSFSRLKSDIENLQKVSREKYAESKRFDLTAEFAFSGKDTAVATAAGVFIDCMATGFTIPVATVLSGAASLLKVKGTSTKSFVHKGAGDKLAYLSKASSEGVTHKQGHNKAMHATSA